jgi:hypothetical protein
MATDNPLAGRVPLNLRTGTSEEIAKSTSYRPGIVHKTEYRNPNQDPSLMRNEGCTPLRRYPDGRLDAKYVADQIIDLVHKVQNAGTLTNFEKAILTLILPGHFQLIDQQIAATMAKMTDEERMMVALIVMRHFNEEQNWNAGRGGGSVPFRNTTRS